jgi:SAM-dependent methyltransferase
MSNYKELYEKVGSVIGWDFSKISKRTERIGEKLLQIARFTKRAYGIDNSKSMIATAKKNLVKSKLSNVEFKIANAKKLPFPKEYFDVVICRHAPFYVKELFRVLKTEGIFITQQVGERDKQNFKNIFGRGQNFKEESGTKIKKYVKELKRHGFKILKRDFYNSIEYYANMTDLMFLFKNTPIIPKFDIKKDQKFLEKIEQRYKTKNGIKTNSFRFLLICKKSFR